MRLNRALPSDTNAEGTTVSRITYEAALRRSVLSCMLWEDSFYEKGSEIAERIAALVPVVSPEKVSAIAIEAREQMKLRHAPLFLCVEMAKHATHRGVVAETLARVIQRPDELAEVLAIYARERTGTKKLGKLAKSIQRGIALAFPKFSAYALAKYDRDGAVKLRDALFLSHAKPKDAEQAETWKRLIAGTLPKPDTWEVSLSETKGENKREAWERLLTEDKLGALALLRNLRNMTQAGVPHAMIADALGKLDVSRVLPFRFVAAARFVPSLEPALEAAMSRAVTELPKLDGRTALIVDTSPSMWQANISAKSDMTRFDAAAALAILARELCAEVRVYWFNRSAGEVPARRGFALRDALAATEGGASCGGLAVELANRDGYDRLVVLTDGQWHKMGAADQYASVGNAEQVSPAPLTERAYMVNVATDRNGVGYGAWTSLNGWSESILDYIRASEVDSETVPE
jgi:60 kDa SS-A/Ro ribonucleoprotein